MRATLLLTLPFVLAACSEPPAAVLEDGVLFAGQAVFADELAEIDSGAVFVNVFNQRGDRIPSYCRKYDVGDPAFQTQGDRVVLNFMLDQTHNMAGMGMPLGEDPQVEVRYDPDGAVETKDGVRSVWTAASEGTVDIALTLDKNAERAAPSSRPASQPASRPASQPTQH